MVVNFIALWLNHALLLQQLQPVWMLLILLSPEFVLVLHEPCRLVVTALEKRMVPTVYLEEGEGGRYVYQQHSGCMDSAKDAAAFSPGLCAHSVVKSAVLNE
jgi:hypothetical protein